MKKMMKIFCHKALNLMGIELRAIQLSTGLVKAEVYYYERLNNRLYLVRKKGIYVR